jgi:hypothetical protein
MRSNPISCYDFHGIRRSVEDALPNDLHRLEWSVEGYTVRDSWVVQMVEYTAIVRSFRLPEGDIRNRVTRPHPALREFVAAAHLGTVM